MSASHRTAACYAGCADKNFMSSSDLNFLQLHSSIAQIHCTVIWVWDNSMDGLLVILLCGKYKSALQRNYPSIHHVWCLVLVHKITWIRTIKVRDTLHDFTKQNALFLSFQRFQMRKNWSCWFLVVSVMKSKLMSLRVKQSILWLDDLYILIHKFTLSISEVECQCTNISDEPYLCSPVLTIIRLRISCQIVSVTAPASSQHV